jgi:CheY-like chemotaxis protein
MCTTPPLEQSNHRAELSGDAKATLAGVLTRVTDIGIHGAAKYQGGESKGVLQEQLVEAIKKGDDCKLEVLKTLQTMIPGLNSRSDSTSAGQELAAGAPRPATSRIARKTKTAKKVLWVDDDPRHLAAEFQELRSNGVEIVEALSTAEAKAAMEKSSFDAVVTDLARDEGNGVNSTAGFDLIKVARSIHINIPIIIYVSPAAVRREKDRATDLGVPIVGSPTQLDQFFRTQGIIR